MSTQTTVFDVAKYIVDQCKPLTAMKLQKLLFYSQAMALVWDERPIFDNDFEAWANGPVCRELFAKHKGMYVLEDSSFLDGESPDISRIAEDHIDTINEILRVLSPLQPYELIDMTHSEAPWIEARQGCKHGEWCDNIIPKERMREFYEQKG